jgi:hypothetical protein
VAAVLREIAAIRGDDGSSSGSGGGGKAARKEQCHEKVVVFSDSKEVLEVLHEATARERGEDAVAMILGTTGFAERMAALAAFKERAACHVLLLSVGACASGLTLTHANHCFLLELQGHGGKEMQLINRVYRIGQERPTSIKRFVAAGTVEERMLHLRKRSRGLLANIDDDAHDDDADTMAVSQVADESLPPVGGAKVKASTAAEQQTERDEDLRYLYGVATPEGTLRNEQQAAEAAAAAAVAGAAGSGGEQDDDEEAVVSTLATDGLAADGNVEDVGDGASDVSEVD